MKKLSSTLVIILLSMTFGFAQKLNEYKASNGINYTIGDTITLGRGSGHNGNFNYLQMGGFSNTLSALNGDYSNVNSGIGRNYSGLNVVIKKIKQQKFKGAKRIVFVVGGGNITNYNLMIEDAIATCEIKDCVDENKTIIVTSSDDKYDKLAKLKKLYDDGVLTEEEYAKEKEKILNSEIK